MSNKAVYTLKFKITEKRGMFTFHIWTVDGKIRQVAKNLKLAEGDEEHPDARGVDFVGYVTAGLEKAFEEFAVNIVSDFLDRINTKKVG